MSSWHHVGCTFVVHLPGLNDVALVAQVAYQRLEVDADASAVAAQVFLNGGVGFRHQQLRVIALALKSYDSTSMLGAETWTRTQHTFAGSKSISQRGQEDFGPPLQAVKAS